MGGGNMKNNFDSNEELYFSWYLDELKDKGYVNAWEKVETSYTLTPGLQHEYIKKMVRVSNKILQQTILKPSVYTPDFKIYWEPKAIGLFVVNPDDTNDKINTPFICDEELISIVETKGTFDNNNMTRLAINNIKFLYYEYNVFVNLIKVPSIFNKTFTPNRYLMTNETLKPRKIKYKYVRNLLQFTKSLQK
jgi:hypothetical protein